MANSNPPKITKGERADEAGRFVEVEDGNRRSFRFGEWVKRDDGYWALRITLGDVLAAATSLRQCDCCGQMRECESVVAFGTDTVACEDCRSPLP
jgi:hypothetical protein